MYHKIILIGSLGRDPEMRYTPDGTPITSFAVATDKRWTDQSGQQQQRTVWFRVTAWRRQAEICSQYLSKGKLVMVEGTLGEPKPYQSRDGEWRASLDVQADAVRFLSGRDEGESGGAGLAPSAGGPAGSTGEEDIPF